MTKFRFRISREYTITESFDREYEADTEAECAAALGVTGRPDNRVHSMSPGADRSKERSRFFPSIARAMAEQWGGFALEMERVAA